MTLIAGVLLTSVGLLALLPYVLRRGWRGQPGATVEESGFQAGLAPSQTFLYQAVPVPEGPVEASPDLSEELEELKASLFSLRLMVGDALVEVQDASELLNGAATEFSTDGV